MTLNIDDINNIVDEAKQNIASCENLNTLLHEVKSAVLGKNSKLSVFLSGMKDLSPEKKKEFGIKINTAKTEIEKNFNNKREELELSELQQKLQTEMLDGTLPCRNTSEGSLHIITKTSIELYNIFKKYGFSLASSGEIEEDFYNFTALNVKKNHPARQMQDTFYLKGKNEQDERYLLRTHTTCVDAREVITNNLQPPIALISLGSTFRCDSDKTHSPMFHQFEGLLIDKDITMGNLKWLLETCLKEFFETDNVVLRLRPSYFPFTEPSVEIDIGYSNKNGVLTIGGSENFLEVLGAGMLHPNVLKNMNIDNNNFNAIAFGLGIERFAMLKYGANDIRQFTASKIDWLKHYSFASFEA